MANGMVTTIAARTARHQRARSRRVQLASARGLISPTVLSSRRGKRIYWVVFSVVAVVCAAVFLFPMFWAVTGALRSTTDLDSPTVSFLPHEWLFSNYSNAWSQLDLLQYFKNTVIQAGGAWVLEIVLLTLAAFALSKLRPRFGGVILGGFLVSMFIPGQAIVVSTYLVAKDLLFIHTNLLDNPLAIWLPAVTSAFNLFILKRFFDQLSDELMEAAEIDGAGVARKLWSIVIPMARPVLAVVSIFAFVAVWQSYLWPLMGFTDPNKYPLSVAVTQISYSAPLNWALAADVLASIPLLVMFVLFQRNIIGGLSGATTG